MGGRVWVQVNQCYTVGKSRCECDCTLWYVVSGSAAACDTLHHKLRLSAVCRCHMSLQFTNAPNPNLSST